MCFSKFEQIENEYGPLEEYYGGAAAKNYASWAAQMAVGLKTGVPWVMCKQDDAPDPIVSSKRDLFTVLHFHCINYFAYCASSWLSHRAEDSFHFPPPAFPFQHQVLGFIYQLKQK